MASVINILVLGECGDGKSTLVDNLRDPEQSAQPLCGKSAEGVTKHITSYKCSGLRGMPFNLIDTPGLFDDTCNPLTWMFLLKDFLTSSWVPGGIHGVIATMPVPSCRIKVGTRQMVQAIIDKGFVAPHADNKYANIILVGTKADKADELEKAAFMQGSSSSNSSSSSSNKSVRELFFKQAVPPGMGQSVMVQKQDCSSLLEAIQQLPVVSMHSLQFQFQFQFQFQCQSILKRKPEDWAIAGALVKEEDNSDEDDDNDDDYHSSSGNNNNSEQQPMGTRKRKRENPARELEAQTYAGAGPMAERLVADGQTQEGGLRPGWVQTPWLVASSFESSESGDSCAYSDGELRLCR